MPSPTIPPVNETAAQASLDARRSAIRNRHVRSIANRRLQAATPTTLLRAGRSIRPSAADLYLPGLNMASVPRFAGREHAVLEMVRILRDFDPDASQAVWTLLRLANPGHTIKVLNQDGTLNQDAVHKLDALAQRLWREGGGGTDTFINTIHLTLITDGGAGVEVEVTPDLADVVDAYPFGPDDIEFKYIKDDQGVARLKLFPTVRVMGGLGLTRGQQNEPLNELQHVYFPLDPAIGDPYGRPPLLSAISALVMLTTLLDEVQKVMHIHGYGMRDIQVNAGAVAAMAPIELRQPGNEQALSDFVSGVLFKIQEQATTINPEDTYVHFDNLTVNTTTGGTVNGPLDSVVSELKRRATTALKSMPILLASAETSGLQGTVQYQVYIKGIKALLRISKRLVEAVYNVALRVWGIPGRVELNYNEIRETDLAIEAAAIAAQINNVEKLYMLGLIDFQEMAQILVHHPPKGQAPPTLASGATVGQGGAIGLASGVTPGQQPQPPSGGGGGGGGPSQGFPSSGSDAGLTAAEGAALDSMAAYAPRGGTRATKAGRGTGLDWLRGAVADLSRSGNVVSPALTANMDAVGRFIEGQCDDFAERPYYTGFHEQVATDACDQYGLNGTWDWRAVYMATVMYLQRNYGIRGARSGLTWVLNDSSEFVSPQLKSQAAQIDTAIEQFVRDTDPTTIHSGWHPTAAMTICNRFGLDVGSAPDFQAIWRALQKEVEAQYGNMVPGDWGITRVSVSHRGAGKRDFYGQSLNQVKAALRSMWNTHPSAGNHANWQSYPRNTEEWYYRLVDGNIYVAVNTVTQKEIVFTADVIYDENVDYSHVLCYDGSRYTWWDDAFEYLDTMSVGHRSARAPAPAPVLASVQGTRATTADLSALSISHYKYFLCTAGLNPDKVHVAYGRGGNLKTMCGVRLYDFAPQGTDDLSYVTCTRCGLSASAMLARHQDEERLAPLGGVRKTPLKPMEERVMRDLIAQNIEGAERKREGWHMQLALDLKRYAESEYHMNLWDKFEAIIQLVWDETKARHLWPYDGSKSGDAEAARRLQAPRGSVREVRAGFWADGTPIPDNGDSFAALPASEQAALRAYAAAHLDAYAGPDDGWHLQLAIAAYEAVIAPFSTTDTKQGDVLRDLNLIIRDMAKAKYGSVYRRRGARNGQRAGGVSRAQANQAVEWMRERANDYKSKYADPHAVLALDAANALGLPVTGPVIQALWKAAREIVDNNPVPLDFWEEITQFRDEDWLISVANQSKNLYDYTKRTFPQSGVVQDRYDEIVAWMGGRAEDYDHYPDPHAVAAADCIRDLGLPNTAQIMQDIWNIARQEFGQPPAPFQISGKALKQIVNAQRTGGAGGRAYGSVDAKAENPYNSGWSYPANSATPLNQQFMTDEQMTQFIRDTMRSQPDRWVFGAGDNEDTMARLQLAQYVLDRAQTLFPQTTGDQVNRCLDKLIRQMGLIRQPITGRRSLSEGDLQRAQAWMEENIGDYHRRYGDPHAIMAVDCANALNLPLMPDVTAQLWEMARWIDGKSTPPEFMAKAQDESGNYVYKLAQSFKQHYGNSALPPNNRAATGQNQWWIAPLKQPLVDEITGWVDGSLPSAMDYGPGWSDHLVMQIMNGLRTIPEYWRAALVQYVRAEADAKYPPVPVPVQVVSNPVASLPILGTIWQTIQGVLQGHGRSAPQRRMVGDYVPADLMFHVYDETLEPNIETWICNDMPSGDPELPGYPGPQTMTTEQVQAAVKTEFADRLAKETDLTEVGQLDAFVRWVTDLTIAHWMHDPMEDEGDDWLAYLPDSYDQAEIRQQTRSTRSARSAATAMGISPEVEQYILDHLDEYAGSHDGWHAQMAVAVCEHFNMDRLLNVNNVYIVIQDAVLKRYHTLYPGRPKSGKGKIEMVSTAPAPQKRVFASAGEVGALLAKYAEWGDPSAQFTRQEAAIAQYVANQVGGFPVVQTGMHLAIAMDAYHEFGLDPENDITIITQALGELLGHPDTGEEGLL